MIRSTALKLSTLISILLCLSGGAAFAETKENSTQNKNISNKLDTTFLISQEDSTDESETGETSTDWQQIIKEFDIVSLLTGLLVGGSFSFILRLHVLKKMSLDLKALGVSLGVEGFDPDSKQEPPQSENQSKPSQTANTPQIKEGNTALVSIGGNADNASIENAGEGIDKSTNKQANNVRVGVSGSNNVVGDTAGGNIDKSSSYNPNNTLKDCVTNLSTQIADVGRYTNGKYEQQSRLYEYNFKDDVDKIHNDIEKYLQDGWFLTTSTLLPDYSGKATLWVVLTKSIPADQQGNIHLNARSSE